MVSHEYTIQDAMGLHARPVTMIARIALSHKQAKITLTCGDKTADAAQLMAVMDMQIKQGDVVVISVEGDREQEIADMVLDIFKTENL